MYVYWQNRGLVLQPESDSEAHALELLTRSVKLDRPKADSGGIPPTVAIRTPA